MSNRIRRMTLVKTPNSIEMNRVTLLRRLSNVVVLTGIFLVCHSAFAQPDTSRVSSTDLSGLYVSLRESRLFVADGGRRRWGGVTVQTSIRGFCLWLVR